MYERMGELTFSLRSCFDLNYSQLVILPTKLLRSTLATWGSSNAYIRNIENSVVVFYSHFLLNNTL